MTTKSVITKYWQEVQLRIQLVHLVTAYSTGNYSDIEFELEKIYII